MITDDPGTPGNGKWENNLAIAFEHRPNETAIDVPAIDLNYGVGEHIQLTLQTAPVLVKRSGQGLIGGLGGTEAALKWRGGEARVLCSLAPLAGRGSGCGGLSPSLSGEGVPSCAQTRG